MSGGRTTYSLGEILDYLDGIFPTMVSKLDIEGFESDSGDDLWPQSPSQDYLEAEDDEIDLRDVVIEDEDADSEHERARGRLLLTKTLISHPVKKYSYLEPFMLLKTQNSFSSLQRATCHTTTWQCLF